MDRAAEVARCVGVQVGERRILLAGLVVGQRVIHDCVLRDFRQRDVLAHVVQVRAVVLAHDKELAAVAEHGRTDAALLEPRVLLNDGNVPAIELAKLGVGFLNDFLAAGNVEEAGNFLIHVPLPQGARQRHDMLARVVGDEETRCGLQLLRRFRDVAQLEVRDSAGEREIARAVEQAAVVPIATPRQDERGDFHDLVALRAHRVEHHQLLKHPVRREFVQGEISKGEIADFLAGLGVFEKQVTFRLREQVANCDGLARARHSKQNRVLRRLVVVRAGESLDADQIVVRAVVNRLGGRQVAGECAGHGQHVGQEAMLRVEFPVIVASPRPTRPRLEKEILRGAGQVALEVLRRVHRVYGVLDRPGFRVEAVARLVPNADREHRVEGHGLPLHQRVTRQGLDPNALRAERNRVQAPPARAPFPPC